MTNQTEAAPAPAPKVQAKLPLLKRIIIAVRNGGGVGMLAVMIGGGLVFILVVGALTFSGGIAVGLKRNKQVEVALATKLKTTREELAHATEEKEKAEKELSAAQSRIDAQVTDMKLLRENLDKTRIEKEALDRVLATVQERLFGGGKGDLAKAALPRKHCEGKAGTLHSKEDLECLNLREAIDSMNGRSSKPVAAAEPAKATAPEPHKSH